MAPLLLLVLSLTGFGAVPWLQDKVHVPGQGIRWSEAQHLPAPSGSSGGNGRPAADAATEVEKQAVGRRLEAGAHSEEEAPPENGVQPLDVGVPSRITIPAIEVDAEVVALGTTENGSLEVPRDWLQAGWWQEGPKPGEMGPAVIVGHLDSKTGPAVFYRLRDLQPGDRVEVEAANGSSVVFQVDRTERYAKDGFPTELVYGLSPGPELRLITCDGFFDRSTGHYEDNLIVFASRVH